MNELARDEVHHSVCCWLVVPRLARLHSAGGSRGHARVVSLRRVLFSFFRQKNKKTKKKLFRSQVSIRIYVQIYFSFEREYVRNRVTKNRYYVLPCALQVDVSNHVLTVRRALFSCAVFFHSFFVWHRVF